ncbi:MAG: ParB/RepB/Spo0J family partition protein, partial [Planctomycetota bacterium]
MSTFQMIPLSSLSAGRQNPRKVQPQAGAHQRLCASIRSRGLLQPLIVVADSEGESGDTTYTVKAGKRRLNALRTIYRNQPDTPVACNVQDVDEQEAAAMALAENVHRENMHPLDEAEAFARIAHVEAKGVGAVAAEFGVPARYVRQRIQLAGLAEIIKAAYRDGHIDTEMAEVFASVPPSTQMEVWNDNGGNFRNANHVRNLIASDWIEAKHARFDLTALPDSKVSRDLFSERVLVERQAFFEAQAEALTAERDALLEEGWAEVLIVVQQDVPDAIYQMDNAPADFDEATTATLEALNTERSKLDEQIEAIGDDHRQWLRSVR